MMESVTRQEQYLNYIRGESTVLPKPVTRIEQLLYDIAINGGIGGGGGNLGAPVVTTPYYISRTADFVLNSGDKTAISELSIVPEKSGLYLAQISLTSPTSDMIARLKIGVELSPTDMVFDGFIDAAEDVTWNRNILAIVRMRQGVTYTPNVATSFVGEWSGQIKALLINEEG